MNFNKFKNVFIVSGLFLSCTTSVFQAEGNGSGLRRRLFSTTAQEPRSVDIEMQGKRENASEGRAFDFVDCVVNTVEKTKAIAGLIENQVASFVDDNKAKMLGLGSILVLAGGLYYLYNISSGSIIPFASVEQCLDTGACVIDEIERVIQGCPAHLQEACSNYVSKNVHFLNLDQCIDAGACVFNAAMRKVERCPSYF